MRKATGFPMLIVSLMSPNEHLRRAVPRQLRQHQHHRRALPRARASATSRIFGAGDYAMRIWVKPDRLAKLGLDGAGSGARGPAAEHGESVRPDRRAAGAARPGDDLHRARAGPAADRGGVRRRSRCDRIPTARSSGCGTSPASSSARSTTSRSAASTASPAARSRSFRRPARTRSRSPTASRSVMADLADAVPAGPATTATRSTRRCRCPKASRRF